MSVRVGVIGAGLMGSTHIRLLSRQVSSAEVVAVSDAVTGNAERIAEEVGAGTIHAAGEDLIRDPAVDAVVIASPAVTHEPFVLACLTAGKPVLCEKPLGATTEASRRVLEAEAALGRQLVQVGFMRRYDPAYTDMKRRLDDGVVGTPVLVHCRHRNANPPSFFTTEMLITDSVVHEIDALRWLLGEEIARVRVITPRSSDRAPRGLRDPQLLIFETDSGVVADVEVFVSAQYGYDVHCEVVADSGTLTLASPAGVCVRRDERLAVEVPTGFGERFATAYTHEMQQWVTSILEGRRFSPSAWDGYAADMVSAASLRSLACDDAVDVRVGDRPDFYAVEPRLASSA